MPVAREDVALDEELDHGINLEQVVAFIRPELPDVRCYVEQTGGGCATIYLGREYCIDTEGRVTCWPSDYARHCDSGHDVFVPVMAGPGWFAAPAWAEGRASPEEFTIGYDCNDPDPDVHADPFSELCWSLDLVYGPAAQYSGERVIARRMVQAYREHPRVKTGEVR